MPFINTKTNIAIPAHKEQEIKAALGEAITLIGKSESWLMLDFQENCRLWFSGDNTRPLAYVEVSLFGSASKKQYDTLTAKITEILSTELGIAPDCIYVRYDEVGTWGWNGANF